jgi:hypothetical protein
MENKVLSSINGSPVPLRGSSQSLAPTSRFLWLSLFLLIFFIVGCGDDRGAKKEDPQRPPWPEEGAPAALHDLAEDMLAYQGTLGRLPNDLAMLDRSGLVSGGPYAKIGYAYHVTGIGVLKDGWRVMVADDRLRQADRLWCIVRPPVRVSGLPGLRVVQIPLDELRAAAATAGGG